MGCSHSASGHDKDYKVIQSGTREEPRLEDSNREVQSINVAYSLHATQVSLDLCRVFKR